LRLLTEMRTRSVSRANDLAENLSVSARTIFRDFARPIANCQA
jgi:predicted DNA-binding transcriptional regulator YafY